METVITVISDRFMAGGHHERDEIATWWEDGYYSCVQGIGLHGLYETAPFGPFPTRAEADAAAREDYEDFHQRGEETTMASIAITDDMTVAEVYALLGVADAYYITQRRALSNALGGDQAFEDWLIDGDVNDNDTIGEIGADWAEWEKERANE